MPKSKAAASDAKVLLSAILRARVPPSEAAKIRAAADRAGMTESKYLRDVILSNKTIVVLPDPKRVFQLNRAGNNLNQIARQVNTANLRGTLSSADFEILIRQLKGLYEYFYLFADAG